MTAAAPADHAAASRLVAALEHAWTAIRSHHPEVPQVIIVVASGSDPRSRRLNLGHFAADRWQLTSPDAPTDRPEVLVSGEGLQRGPVDVLGTLLHEAAYGLSPLPARSATPAVKAATTTAATPPSPASSAWRSPTWTPSAGPSPASPTKPPPATPRRWPSWERRWCCGAGPSRPARPGRAAPVPWPARVAVAAASVWRGPCWSWPRFCVAPAPSPSSPRTTNPVDAYQRVAETLTLP
jgi:hypothetical protein